MKKIVVIVGAALVLVAGCQSAEDQTIAEAQRLAADLLRDPSSAQFRHLRYRVAETGARVVCGEINGKNAYGGYPGFQRFLYDSGNVKLDERDDPDFDRRWLRLCL